MQKDPATNALDRPDLDKASTLDHQSSHRTGTPGRTTLGTGNDRRSDSYVRAHGRLWYS